MDTGSFKTPPTNTMKLLWLILNTKLSEEIVLTGSVNQFTRDVNNVVLPLLEERTVDNKDVVTYTTTPVVLAVAPPGNAKILPLFAVIVKFIDFLFNVVYSGFRVIVLQL